MRALLEQIRALALESERVRAIEARLHRAAHEALAVLERAGARRVVDLEHCIELVLGRGALEVRTDALSKGVGAVLLTARLKCDGNVMHDDAFEVAKHPDGSLSTKVTGAWGWGSTDTPVVVSSDALAERWGERLVYCAKGLRPGTPVSPALDLAPPAPPSGSALARARALGWGVAPHVPPPRDDALLLADLPPLA